MEETSEVWANVPVPQWPRLQPTDGKVWHLKLPAYVNLESRPYNEDYYRATADDNEEELKGFAAKGKMIGVRNTIRWRWAGKDGEEPTRQSNARMLRWSDGSVSLQLGSEMFDLAPSYGASLKRGEDDKRGNETTFVCVAAPNEQVLVTESAVAGQLSLVPTSMDSKTHRELVNHVGQQHVKHSRMKILDDEEDPEKVAELLARAGPQRPVMPTRPTRPSSHRRSQGSGLGRTKRAIKRADSEESDLGSPIARRGGGDYDEDDGFVVADSDEEYEAASRKKSKKKTKRGYSDDSMDEAELADARIEELEREKKRARKDKGKSRSRAQYSDDEDEEDDAEGEVDDDEEEAEMDMDVESEEE